MNRMPGFGAGASLTTPNGRHSRGRTYAPGASGATSDSARVLLQQDSLETVLDTGCAISCSAACNVAIAGGYKAWRDCLDACYDFCS